MTLIIQDHACREPDRMISDVSEISAEVRRLATLLGWTVEQTREELVCGRTIVTVGYLYTLVS